MRVAADSRIHMSQFCSLELGRRFLVSEHTERCAQMHATTEAQVSYCHCTPLRASTNCDREGQRGKFCVFSDHTHKSLIVSTLAGCSVLLPWVFPHVRMHLSWKPVQLAVKSFSMYPSIKSSVTSSLLAWPSLVTSISFTGAALFSTKASGECVAVDMYDGEAAHGRPCVLDAVMKLELPLVEY